MHFVGKGHVSLSSIPVNVQGRGWSRVRERMRKTERENSEKERVKWRMGQVDVEIQ